MALGAGSADVVRLILGQSLWIAAAGVAIGLAGSRLLTNFLSSLLFGVKVNDPVTFTLVALTLTIVALLASFVPAFRAASIDPVDALRQE